MYHKDHGTSSTLIWFAVISERAAQETAVGGVCPRGLVKLHLSPSLFDSEAELVSDVAEIMRFAKGHRKSATETGPNVGPLLQGETIVEQIFLGRICQTLINKCLLWSIPLQSLLASPGKLGPDKNTAIVLFIQPARNCTGQILFCLAQVGWCKCCLGEISVSATRV